MCRQKCLRRILWEKLTFSSKIGSEVCKVPIILACEVCHTYFHKNHMLKAKAGEGLPKYNAETSSN